MSLIQYLFPMHMAPCDHRASRPSPAVLPSTYYRDYRAVPHYYLPTRVSTLPEVLQPRELIMKNGNVGVIKCVLQIYALKYALKFMLSD